LILPHIITELNKQSKEGNLEVEECSEEIAEVTAMGGSAFRFLVNLKERTCTCRQWDVSRIPCKHALAFITSLDASIESYVDLYYSVEKFSVAYSQLIPAMPDKSQWPKSNHGFFMHPPLFILVAGRPKTERHKGTSDQKKRKGQHQCPICLDYGHHFSPNLNHLSIYNICRSRSGSNQPEALSTAHIQDRLGEVKKKRTGIKKKLGLPKKKGINKTKVPPDSPAMGTRSKKGFPSSPAMSTRGKRRLSL
jgi:hypothetical protein